MIYLDNNATTPVDPEVYDAVFSCLKRDFGNPSSSHLLGRKAKEFIESSRASIAEFLGCTHEEICFTSGGTESNNLAILGSSLLHRSGHIITSSIEHPSVINTCRHLESLGFDITFAPVDNDGIVRLDKIREAVRKNTFLISVMHSNNETGVIQPIKEIGALARENNIAFHVDSAQSIGKMHFSLNDLKIDLMTIVSHKFYGPKGVGALFIRKGINLKPIFYGACHEMGIRPGTENVPGIIGLGKACEIAQRDLELRVSHTTGLRDLLFNNLKTHIPDIKLNGHPTKRLPNTLNICLPGISSLALIEKIKNHVAVSSGSACNSGKQTPSNVLKNMGLSDEEALSSIRLSVGKDNTEAEINEASEIIAQSVFSMKKAPVR
ncbi:MAG: cysteine desulfurase family protein [Nitrospirota bacterium]